MVHGGRGEHELSPEEDEAIRLALAGEPVAHRDARLMRVGYLGPAGTVSHEALTAAPGAGGFEPVPQPTLHAAVLAVHDGSVDRALVPIENALEGSVNPTLDALGVRDRRRRDRRRARQPVHLCLVAPAPLELADVRTVVSIPQATAQCARFLREAAAARPIVAAPRPPTRSARWPTGSRPRRRSGTRRAAERYGCAILRENVEDHPDNETRFVWLARSGTAGRRAAIASRRRSSSGAPARPARAGSSAACRSSRSRDVNLTRIESRPLRQRLGEYMFFVDLEGRLEDAGGRRRRRRAARARRRGACARVVSSAPEPPGRYGYTAASAMSSHPSTTTGVRAARRPPAARAESNGTGRWSGGRVLVLNATYEPINVCTVRRATVLLLKEKAEVLELGATELHWATGSLPARSSSGS